MEREALISFQAAGGGERLLARALREARGIPKTRALTRTQRSVTPAGRKPGSSASTSLSTRALSLSKGSFKILNPGFRRDDDAGAVLRVKTRLSRMGLLIELKRLEARLDPGRVRLSMGILSYGRSRGPMPGT